jgi:hypothetical protein
LMKIRWFMRRRGNDDHELSAVKGGATEGPCDRRGLSSMANESGAGRPQLSGDG